MRMRRAPIPATLLLLAAFLTAVSARGSPASEKASTRDAEYARIQAPATLVSIAATDVDAAVAEAEIITAGWEDSLGSHSLELAGRLHGIAEMFLDRSAPKAAEPYCRRVFAIVHAALGPDHPAMTEVSGLLMWHDFASGNLAGALDHQAEAVRVEKLYRTADDPRLAKSLSDLAALRHRLGDYRGAASAWEEALNVLLAAEPPDHFRIANNQSNLAETWRTLGDADRAEKLFTEALERTERELPVGVFRAKLLNNLGGLYWDQGRLDDAERLFREALRISEADSAADQRRLATGYLNLGVLKRTQGQVETAEPLLERALATGRPAIGTGDPALVIFLLEAGNLHYETGRAGRALQLWNEGLSILDGQKTPPKAYRALLMYKIARAQLDEGRYAESKVLLEETLALQESALGAEHPDAGVTLVALAEATERLDGVPASAERRLERGLELLEKTSTYPEPRAEGYALRARFHRDTGRPEAAIKDLERAVTVVEDLRTRRGGGDLSRARFLERYLGYYDQIVSLMVDRGRIEEALQYSERRRARVLYDHLSARDVDLHAGIPLDVLEPLLRREYQARSHLSRIQQEILRIKQSLAGDDAAARKRLATLEIELEAALSELRDADALIQIESPVWKHLLENSGGRVTSSALQGHVVGPGQFLLMYHVGPASSLVFVVPPAPERPSCLKLDIDPDQALALGTRAGPLTEDNLERLVGLIPEGTPQGLVASLRGVIGTRPISGTTSTEAGGSAGPKTATPAPSPGMNRELTPAGLVQQVLVPPRLWDRVRKAEEVVIVPDGVLHLLPFEALIVSNDSRGARYWLDEGPVVRYGHSLTSLVEEALAPERAATSGSILSLSDPDFGDEGHSLPRLPGTARESEAIARLFPSRTIVLKGEAASEEGLRRHLEGVRYLHMATHGLADMNHGEMASLALTPSGSDASDRDGFLNLFEIYDLRLDCELAVLSACDTRIGPRLEGEGVFALSRGFQSAGARRTVASLWQAADESTALLIESFFQGIADAERAGKRIEYSRLLRDAKRRVRARPEWSSPFYWAPLVLTGKG